MFFGYVEWLSPAARPRVRIRLAAASPFFAQLDLPALGVRHRTPKVAFAHPLDGGRAGWLAGSVDETAAGLGHDGTAYRC